MSDTTPRFQLPFILPGQAQKEVFHNEALQAIDALLHPAVEGAPTADVPPAPAEGQSFIVGSGASGAWTEREHQIATWSSGGWRFAVAPPGTRVWNKAAGIALFRSGDGWTGRLAAAEITIDGQKVVGNRQPAVPSPSGGTIIDIEARAAIAAVIATLLSHGLTE